MIRTVDELREAIINITMNGANPYLIPIMHRDKEVIFYFDNAVYFSTRLHIDGIIHAESLSDFQKRIDDLIKNGWAKGPYYPAYERVLKWQAK